MIKAKRENAKRDHVTDRDDGWRGASWIEASTADIDSQIHKTLPTYNDNEATGSQHEPSMSHLITVVSADCDR